MKQTRFKMLVPKRRGYPTANRREIIQYWQAVDKSGERQLVFDNFAGGGGASTGLEEALGHSVDGAVNHDPAAIAMHEVNHPETKHYCESVWDVDPRDLARGRPVGIAWFSPDCKHFSKAKGGTPVDKSIRGLAWVVLRWAGTVKPRIIFLENVEEFKTWGPLIQGEDGEWYPDPKQKGRTFKAFVNALRRQGYDVEWRELRACDYGAPTSRKRLFLIARCDGKAIVWPEPTHGDPTSEAVTSGKLKPWRTAAEIIDWSIPCRSIFGRKKPLAENTLRRIARGIERYVINNPKPFIIKVNHAGETFRGQQTDEPLHTVTSKNGCGIVTPYITRIGQTGFGGDNLSYNVESPVTTVTTKAEHLLVTPTLIQMGYGDPEGRRVLDLEKPLGTVTAGGNKFAVAAAYVSREFGQSTGHAADAPLGTVTAAGGGKSQLVAAFLAKHYGGNYTGPGADMEQPTPTITATDHNALVTSHLIKLRGTCQDGQEVTEPMPTITAGGLHVGEVRSFLIKYYGTGIGQQLDEPLDTVVTKDRFGLITIEGVDYQIVDIGMRMLRAHELFAAQGFPPEYIIDRYQNGKKVPQDEQVNRCGNSVVPVMAEALARANAPEMCTGSGKALTFERYKQAEAGQMALSM